MFVYDIVFGQVVLSCVFVLLIILQFCIVRLGVVIFLMFGFCGVVFKSIEVL